MKKDSTTNGHRDPVVFQKNARTIDWPNSSPHTAALPSKHAFPTEIITVSTSEGIELVHLNKIKRLSAERAYTRFHFEDGTYLLASHNIGEYARLLSESTFCFYRLHESHIVNLHFMRRFLFEDGGVLEMEDGARIPVAKRRKKNLLEWLRTINTRCLTPGVP